MHSIDTGSRGAEGAAAPNKMRYKKNQVDQKMLCGTDSLQRQRVLMRTS